MVAAAAAFQRAGVDPGDIDYAVIGQVVQAGAGHIPSRQVTLAVGMPDEIGSDTVNKVCASGMRAVALADLMVRAGDRRLLLAGGMESMSNAPYLLLRARSGYRFGDGELIDANLSDGLRDPWSDKLMYEQASAVADELGLTRAELDEWALRSHQRADRRHRLRAHGRGDRRRRGAGRGGPDARRHRRGAAARHHAGAPGHPAAARPEHPTHTAGNSPASTTARRCSSWPMPPLAARARARAPGAHPRNRQHGQPPRFAGAGARDRRPEIALERAGLTRERHGGRRDQRGLRRPWRCSRRATSALDAERVNVNGGAVALGHPVGASGARLVGTLLHELRRRGGGRGLAAICSGGGQGDAIVIEVDGA